MWTWWVVSFLTKIKFALLFLGLYSAAYGGDFADIKVPLQIKSDFVVRNEVGPPSDRTGLNRYAACYLFKFNKIRYSRDISFSKNRDYVYITDSAGDYDLSESQTYSFKEFLGYRRQYTFNETWQDDLKTSLGKIDKSTDQGGVKFTIPIETPKVISSIIGEGKSNIQVSGYRSISFSGKSEWEDGLENTGTFKQSKFPSLQMEQKSRFKVTGTIGSKITVEVDQDSQRDVDLANTIKLRYKGDENDIVQSVEAGNTNLSLPNATFIGYSQNVQGLFGIKATGRVGNLDLTMITSQEKGSSEKATFNAGARGTENELKDWQYLPNTYFWLGIDSLRALSDSISIRSVELYKSHGQPQQGESYPRGLACVTPLDSLPFVSSADSARGGEYLSTYFEQIDQTQYELYKASGFVVLDQQLDENISLGAYIKYVRYRGNIIDTMTVGSLSYRPNTSPDTTLVLKLLKLTNSNPTYATWNLMWRNVYDLGSRNISSEGFDLKIYMGQGGQGGQINDVDNQNSVCFITLLGLDSLNNNNPSVRTPDCIFDFNNTVIDASKGHLIFPERHPFDSPNLTVRTPEIYQYTPGSSRLSEFSKYYLRIKTSQRSSSYPLGRANIIEGSEVVKLGDGTVLRRGVDYNIVYDIGQITFLSEEAMNPAANVSVDFAYAPFFMPEKKTLFGIAGQYQLLENSNISIAAMYRSEAASDPRPRVGREPTKGFVWDSNFSFRFQPDLMTKMVDALPLVESDAQSSLEITGEIAQSLPNPNTKNEAFIDDFEGTKTATDLGMRRSIWTICSPPVDSANQKANLTRRGFFWWYNPYDVVSIKSIWPNRQVRSEDDRQDVLYFNFNPDSSASTPESTSTSPDLRWGGIMRSIYSGMADQSLTKFIEIWYLPDPNSASRTDDPTLHIDFGQISEDLNDNTELDSEDSNHDNVFTLNEDTGLGILRDDEWSYSADRREDYSHINGTKNNNNDPDRRGRFDTEDIDNSGSLNMQNGYFEYTVHLKDTLFVVDQSVAPSGTWKLLRIPLQDPNAYNVMGARASADFTKLNYARLWFSGASEPYFMKMASFELVGNKWQEDTVRATYGAPLGPNEKLEVTVKNTQENSSYYPPPGIAGNLDRATGIREKEQSLVLSYQEMTAGHAGQVYWDLYQSENYTLYQTLKMYVHGDSSSSSGKVTFFFRLGTKNTENYYEYRTVLQPDWNENNWVEIDFNKMTALKYEMMKRVRPESLLYADTTDGHYRVHGNPALSQISGFWAGVEIDTSATGTYTGEVWLDEMRVSNVRKKTDFAGKLQVNAKFADFLDLTLAYNKTGSDFVMLSSKIPSGMATTNKSIRLSTKLDKFFSPDLGLALPATFTYSTQISLPRLKPGSDIILNRESQQIEKSLTRSASYSFSEAFNRNTNNWLWNLTLNRINTSYFYSISQNNSPALPLSRLLSYKMTGAYDLTPKAKPSFKPLVWTKYLLMPKVISGADCFPLPTQFKFTANLDGSNKTERLPSSIQTYSRVKDLTLTASTGLNLFSSTRTNYSMGSTRDISDPASFKMSINPSKIKLGKEKTLNQRFDTNFIPKLSKLFDTKFTFNSSYDENTDIRQNSDGTRSTRAQNGIRIETRLNVPMLIPKDRGKSQMAPPPDKGNDNKSDEGTEPGQSDDKPKDDNNGQPSKGSPKWILKKMVGALSMIQPIQANYQKNKDLSLRGLVNRPSMAYIFGFSQNPHALVKDTPNLQLPNQSTTSNNIEISSGLQPFTSLSVTTGYQYKYTVTRSSNEPLFDKSATFPDLNFTLNGLEKLSFLTKLSSSVNLQTAFQKIVTTKGQADTKEVRNRETVKNFYPLMSLKFIFKNNVSASIRYDRKTGKTENLRGEGQSKVNTENSDNTLKISFSYSLSAPKGIKLPLLKKIKFDSQLSMALDITIRNTIAENLVESVRTPTSKTVDLTIEPKLSYQFSRAITGGLNGAWTDTNNKITQRKHHIRRLGIWTEIRF